LPDRLIGKSLPRPDAHLLDYKIPTMSRAVGHRVTDLPLTAERVPGKLRVSA
jgi:hypothetical protein